jgi:hypothetical protein
MQLGPVRCEFLCAFVSVHRVPEIALGGERVAPALHLRKDLGVDRRFFCALGAMPTMERQVLRLTLVLCRQIPANSPTEMWASGISSLMSPDHASVTPRLVTEARVFA